MNGSRVRAERELLALGKCRLLQRGRQVSPDEFVIVVVPLVWSRRVMGMPERRQPGLPTRFARVLGRQVAAGELVTAQRRNPAQRAGCG